MDAGNEEKDGWSQIVLLRCGMIKSIIQKIAQEFDQENTIWIPINIVKKILYLHEYNNKWNS